MSTTVRIISGREAIQDGIEERGGELVNLRVGRNC